ncbi:MAG: maleate cis-trans isomerase [Dehalococcoidia bacterium]|nr:maleate cis-trans isomerase [Dehalococcoidia bacterium]
MVLEMKAPEAPTSVKERAPVPSHLLDSAPPGWRARIGIIMPSAEQGATVREYELLFPQGVVPLVTRMMFRQPTVEDLIRMSKDAEYAAELLATAFPHSTSYTCTSGAFVMGLKYDQDLMAKIERITRAPATTMAYAVVEALRSLKAKNIVVVAPYTEDIVAAELKYYPQHGFNVVSHKGLNIAEVSRIMAIPPWETHELAVRAFREAPRGTDAIFITCGGLRAVEIIDYVERDTGVPCVSSNQANAWHCLKLAGIHEPIYGFGKLLEMPR